MIKPYVNWIRKVHLRSLLWALRRKKRKVWYNNSVYMLRRMHFFPRFGLGSDPNQLCYGPFSWQFPNHGRLSLAFIIDWRVMDEERAVFSLQDVLKYFWVNILFSTLRFFFGRMDLFEKGQLDRNVCVAHQYKAIFPYCCHPLTL